MMKPLRFILIGVLAFLLVAGFARYAMAACEPVPSIIDRIKHTAIEHNDKIEVWYNSHDGDVIKEAVYLRKKGSDVVLYWWFRVGGCVVYYHGRITQVSLYEDMKETLDKAHLVFSNIDDGA